MKIFCINGKNRSKDSRPLNQVLIDYRKCNIVGLMHFSLFFVQCVQLHENVNKQHHLYGPKERCFVPLWQCQCQMSIITNGLICEELHMLKVCPKIWLPPGTCVIITEYIMNDHDLHLAACLSLYDLQGWHTSQHFHIAIVSSWGWEKRMLTITLRTVWASANRRKTTTMKTCLFTVLSRYVESLFAFTREL